MKIIIRLLSLFFFLIILGLILDYHSSFYGNGIYFLEKPLRFNLNVTRINDVLINYYGEGESYIKPNINYNDSLPVIKLLGYNAEAQNLLIKIETDSARKVCLVFKDEQSVQQFGPKIMSESSCNQNYGNDGWIDLENPPLLVYYSKPIVFLLFLISLVIGIITAIKCVLKILQAYRTRTK